MNEGGRPAWSDVRGALERRGFRPSRRFGQNFLLDENMVRAIVRDAELTPEDRVLEVGPGCGFLTLHLARTAREVLAVEIDPRLLEVARELCAECTNVRWILGDVLAGKHALAPAVATELAQWGAWRLVANLPYSVSAPVLALLATAANPPVSMTVLVQKEVAERIAARPGTADWGPLSIRLQLDYEPQLARSVPPSLFWPRPEVESTVAHLVRRPAEIDVELRAELDRLVTRVFQRRRQALGRVLTEDLGRERAEAVLLAAGLAREDRAEGLGLAGLLRLAREVGIHRATAGPPPGPRPG